MLSLRYFHIYATEQSTATFTRVLFCYCKSAPATSRYC